MMTSAAAAGPSGWAWLAMAVSVLVLAGFSVGAYVLLFRGGGGRPVRHQSAERRLADQFARRQITEQEYLHLMAALGVAGSGRRRGPHASTAPRSARLDQPRVRVHRRGHDRPGP